MWFPVLGASPNRALPRPSGNQARTSSLIGSLDPDSRSVLESLAKVFEERGKSDKAIACTKKILALDRLADLTATNRATGTGPGKESADSAVQRDLLAFPRSPFQKFRILWSKEKE